jgi:allantoinase
VERLEAVAKCSPPLRRPEEQTRLWEQLVSGEIQFVASDHSPAPPELKTAPNFFEVWGGISGCQALLSLLLTEGHAARKLPLSLLARLTAESVARRFQIPRKGRLAIGADADIVLVDLQAQGELRADDLYYRHRQSPYIGRRWQGRIVQTLVRGVTVYRQGHFPLTRHGQLVTPTLP